MGALTDGRTDGQAPARHILLGLHTRRQVTDWPLDDLAGALGLLLVLVPYARVIGTLRR